MKGEKNLTEKNIGPFNFELSVFKCIAAKNLFLNCGKVKLILRSKHLFGWWSSSVQLLPVCSWPCLGSQQTMICADLCGVQQ